MKQLILKSLALILLAPFAYGEEPEADAEDGAIEEAASEEIMVEAAEEAGGNKEPGGPKTMSGMSILGNEEAPKSLVIIPWKSSEIGSDLGLDDSLGERAEPVDRDVFLRELEFYEIRSGE